jgi:hypothetical protein
MATVRRSLADVRLSPRERGNRSKMGGYLLMAGAFVFLFFYLW